MLDQEFLWLGNHPAPDLCNTAPVIDGRRVDLLTDLDALVRWCAACGIDGPAGDVPVRAATGTLRWARDLRAALRDVLDPTATTGGARAALNTVLAEDAGVLEVRDGPEGQFVTVSSTDDLRRFRLELAWAVLDIFHYDLSLVRRCANPECVLLFLDVSKSGRRRWCSMAVCGNRAKVAAHYARHHTVSSGGSGG